jgi:hypothetical protein
VAAPRCNTAFVQRLALAGLVACGVALLPAGDTSAAEQRGALALVLEVPPFAEETIRVLTDAPSGLPAGRRVGDIRDKDGAKTWPVTVVEPAACEGDVRRSSGITGVPVCLSIERFPSATAASGDLPLSPTAAMTLGVSSHHPRWTALVVAALALLAGVVFAYVALKVIPAIRRREDLDRAQNAAVAAGILGVAEWLADLPPSVGPDGRVTLVTDATALLPKLLADDRESLRNRLGSLAAHPPEVVSPFDRPDVSRAVAEAQSAALYIDQLYDRVGRTVASDARRWRDLVDLLALVADRITDFADLLPRLPAPDQARARSALEVYVKNFRDLAFASPAVPVANIESIRQEMGQLFKEYAQIPEGEIPTSGLAPAPAAPTTVPKVRSSGRLARGIIVVGGFALAAAIVLQVAMGDTFGTLQNYLVLVVTAFVAGLSAQLLLDVVPYASRRT